MKKSPLIIQCALVVLATLLLLWTVPASADHHMKPAEAAKTVYVCGCGPACACQTIADQPGKCRCGKELVERQVVKEEADKVYVCACPDGCKCGAGQGEPVKCACGKEPMVFPKAGKMAGCAHQMGDKAAAEPCACCAKKPADAK